MAFRGTFDYTLDSKNRLTVPAKFRAALADGGVLAQGIEQCVALYTPAGYEDYIAATLQGRNPASPDARKLRRFFAANSLDVELDAAGRIGVPAFLIDHAGLDKDVVVTGAEDCLEVWDRGAWATYNAELVSEVNDITAQMGAGFRETGA
jgi:MraZ protein